MRVDAASLPAAAQTHSRIHGASRQFPEKAAEKANANALSNFPTAEELAARPAENADTTAKTAPRGLDNAIARHEAKPQDNAGIANALAMLQQNLSRHTVATPAAGTPAETTNTSETTPSDADTGAV